MDLTKYVIHVLYKFVLITYIYELAVLLIFVPKRKEGSSVQWMTFSVSTYDSRMDKSSYVSRLLLQAIV